jgi:hypothetical protein
MSNWFKKQMASLAFAMSNVEKNTLGQESINGGIETSKHQRLNQNSVMDALLRGEITEEVEKLRWRIYKTSQQMKYYSCEVVGINEDGSPITEIRYFGDEERLLKIKTEPSDDYKLIMVVDNRNVSAGVNETLGLDIDEYKISFESKTKNIINEDVLSESDEVNNQSDINLDIGKTTTIGEVKDNKVGLNLPISVTRKYIPKFKIENYTKKIHIKKITNKEFLLELYVSKYPEQFDKQQHFFLSNVKNILSNPTKYNSIVDIDTISFVSNNTVGVPDFLEYEYKVIKLSNLVEFNEYYVFKFISEVTIEAKSIIEQFKNEELEEKYKNKEKR